MPGATEFLLRLFRERGGSRYGGEDVTQLEHALQAATLANIEGASAELIAAAFLHDVGHLLHSAPDDAPDHGWDDRHEDLGAKWLNQRVNATVAELVRMHVPAKRYLCATRPEYYASLSQPSVVSLRLQGGPMTSEECSKFEQSPLWQDAIRLRLWDDAAKVPGARTLSLDDMTPILKGVILEDRFA